MKQWLLYPVLFVLLAACGGNKKEKQFNNNNYQEEKQSLVQKEKQSPLHFLEITENKDKRNWFGQTVVKGTIRNNASLCSYKDIRVKLRYFNKQQQQVANHEIVYDQVLAPGKTLDFKERFSTPKGTDSVAVSLMSAVAK